LQGRSSHDHLFCVRFGKGNDLFGTFWYGVACGFASTGYSAPVFYALVPYSLTFKSLAQGLGAFLAHAFDIGLPLVAVSMLVGLGRTAFVSKITIVIPFLHRISEILPAALELCQILRYFSVP